MDLQSFGMLKQQQRRMIHGSCSPNQTKILHIRVMKREPFLRIAFLFIFQSLFSSSLIMSSFSIHTTVSSSPSSLRRLREARNEAPFIFQGRSKSKPRLLFMTLPMISTKGMIHITKSASFGQVEDEEETIRTKLEQQQKKKKKLDSFFISPLRSLWSILRAGGIGVETNIATDTSMATVTTSITDSKNLNKTTHSLYPQSSSALLIPTCNSSITVTTNTAATATAGSEEQETKKNSTMTKETLIPFHSYYHIPTNTTLYGLGLSLRKFQAYLTYTLQQQQQQEQHSRGEGSADTFESIYVNSSDIQTQYIQPKNHNQTLRNQFRQYWFQRSFITDRTEVLAEYQSDKKQQQVEEENKDTDTVTTTSKAGQEQEGPYKRGGFNDLLHSFSKRFISILQDEEDTQWIILPTATTNDTGTSNHNIHHHTTLLDWLISDYGEKETKELLHTTFKTFESQEQIHRMQHFLTWFRNQFPYYYDRCNACGISFREEERSKTHQQQQPVVEEGNKINEEERMDNTVSIQEISSCDGTSYIIEKENNDEEERKVLDPEDDGSTFLGYIYPSVMELNGKASRTELFLCHKCGHYTRFPRYNTASSIIGYKRGRCGEYSMLSYRILRALGHEARWIVDWADHVWVECFFPNKLDKKGRWVHLGRKRLTLC